MMLKKDIEKKYGCVQGVPLKLPTSLYDTCAVMYKERNKRRDQLRKCHFVNWNTKKQKQKNKQQKASNSSTYTNEKSFLKSSFSSPSFIHSSIRCHFFFLHTTTEERNNCLTNKSKNKECVS